MSTKEFIDARELKINNEADLGFIFKNGKDPHSGKGVRISDAISVPNIAPMLPKVINNVIREAQEPLLVGTSLLNRINYSYGQTITLGSVGALVAGDIAEGAEYPEQSLQMGGGTLTATIGKSGLAVKVTEEVIRYSQWDVLGMHLRAAGRALARHKEQKIFNMIRKMGQTVFDNKTPSASLLGATTGRSLSGAANGSVTMDDIFDCFAQVMQQGFMPDTLLMHPLSWVMWVKDPILRHWVTMNNGGTFFANWTGNVNTRYGENANQGGLGIGSGNPFVPGGNAAGLPATSALGVNQWQNSAPVLPPYLGMNFKIIVSPFVPFDPRTKLTDIYMFDSQYLGALIVDEEITTEEFRDPRVDITKIKVRERYGLAILEEGLAIATIKNAKVVPNEVVLPAITQLNVAGDGLEVLDPTASPL